MVRGFYTAATGMEVQRKKMDVITNNITNVDTQGYKKEWLVSTTFDDVMIQRQHDSAVAGQGTQAGPFNYGTRIDEVFVDHSQGIFEETGDSTDIAIAGSGFFVVGTPQGERLTRASAYNVDNNGYLVDGNGNFLLGNSGPIKVDSTNFSVNDRGVVSAGGRDIDTIRVARVEDDGTLRKLGDNLYTTTTGTFNAAFANEYTLKQGFVEGSNVNIAREMVDMMTVYRVYETNQKALSMIDELTGRAVNEIAQVG